MFGHVNGWQITELNIFGEIKFGKWIDFGLKDTIYKLSWLKFGKSQTTRQIRQTFPLPNIPAIWYSKNFINLYRFDCACKMYFTAAAVHS